MAMKGKAFYAELLEGLMPKGLAFLNCERQSASQSSSKPEASAGWLREYLRRFIPNLMRVSRLLISGVPRTGWRKLIEAAAGHDQVPLD